MQTQQYFNNVTIRLARHLCRLKWHLSRLPSFGISKNVSFRLKFAHSYSSYHRFDGRQRMKIPVSLDQFIMERVMKGHNLNSNNLKYTFFSNGTKFEVHIRDVKLKYIEI